LVCLLKSSLCLLVADKIACDRIYATRAVVKLLSVFHFFDIPCSFFEIFIVGAISRDF